MAGRHRSCSDRPGAQAGTRRRGVGASGSTCALGGGVASIAAANRSNRGPEACRTPQGLDRDRSTARNPVSSVHDAQPPMGSSSRSSSPSSETQKMAVLLGCFIGQTCEPNYPPTCDSFMTGASISTGSEGEPPTAAQQLPDATRPSSRTPSAYPKPRPVASHGISRAHGVQVCAQYRTSKIVGRTQAGIKQNCRLSCFDQTYSDSRPIASRGYSPASPAPQGSCGARLVAQKFPFGRGIPATLDCPPFRSRLAGARRAANEKSQPPARRCACPRHGRSGRPAPAPARSRPAPRPTAAGRTRPVDQGRKGRNEQRGDAREGRRTWCMPSANSDWPARLQRQNMADEQPDLRVVPARAAGRRRQAHRDHDRRVPQVDRLRLIAAPQPAAG